jgi:hypothetical protein
MWVTARVIDRHDGNLIIIDPINDYVRKPANACEPEILKDLGVQLGRALNASEDVSNAGKKNIAQPDTQTVIPGPGIGQIGFRLWVDDQGQTHGLLP